jgi:D-tyrosyl-tRNA(Tyr) deacylase
MRILIQRVSRASVRVGDQVSGAIGYGLLAFLGIREGDTEREIEWLAEKVAALRVFEDEEGKMNLSLQNIDGSLLVVSQFTLYGETRRGNRPSFMNAARPEKAERLYDLFVDSMRVLLGEHRVATGVFQAMMQVELINDGPVTILLEKEADPVTS